MLRNLFKKLNKEEKMKRLTLILMLTVLALGIAQVAIAGNSQKNDFTVQAYIPAGSGVQLAVREFTPSADGSIPDDQWNQKELGINENKTLDFGELNWDAKYKVYYSTKAFLIEAYGDRGQALNTVNVTYADNSIPSGQPAAKSLGKRGKTVITKAYLEDMNNDGILSPSETKEAVISKQSFSKSNNKSISASQLNGGWFRMWVGLLRGSSTEEGADQTDKEIMAAESDVSPFLGSDKTGNYSGTLTVSATIQ